MNTLQEYDLAISDFELLSIIIFLYSIPVAFCKEKFGLAFNFLVQKTSLAENTCFANWYRNFVVLSPDLLFLFCCNKPSLVVLALLL